MRLPKTSSPTSDSSLLLSVLFRSLLSLTSSLSLRTPTCAPSTPSVSPSSRLVLTLILLLSHQHILTTITEGHSACPSPPWRAQLRCCFHSNLGGWIGFWRSLHFMILRDGMMIRFRERLIIMAFANAFYRYGLYISDSQMPGFDRALWYWNQHRILNLKPRLNKLLQMTSAYFVTQIELDQWLPRCLEFVVFTCPLSRVPTLSR